MKLTRRRAVLGAGALGVTILIVWSVRPSPQLVEAVATSRGPLRVTIDEEGRTRVRDRYLLVAPAAGRVERITLDEGAKLRRGDTVARLFAAPLDPRGRQEAAARLRAAEDVQRAAQAAVEQARAARDQARRERARAESLFARNLVAAEQRERAALADTTAVRQFEAANFRAQAAAHDVDQARAALSSGDGHEVLLLVSPVRGQVLRIPEKSERVVAAGEPLVEIGDPSRLEVVVDLLSEDAVKVEPGDMMIVEAWGGDRPLEAHVRLVEPAGFTKVSALGVEEQRVNVIADLDETPPRLGDGYRVEAKVVLWQGAEVLKIPTSAVIQEGAAARVFLVQNGRARLREIQVGHRNAFEAEVTGGLSVGDRVIPHPTDKLFDGVRITVRSPGPGR